MVTAFTSAVTALTSAVTALTSAVTALTSAVTALTSAVPAFTSSVAARGPPMTAHLGAVTDLPPVSADSDEAGERTPGEGEDMGFSDTL